MEKRYEGNRVDRARGFFGSPSKRRRPIGPKGLLGKLAAAVTRHGFRSAVREMQ